MKAVYIPVDNTEIYCRISGEGKPLILLHGNGEDSSIFEDQIEAFSQKYQVIAIDTRGHGRSEHGQYPLSFTRLALDVVEVMDYFNVRKAAIVGFSDGGNIALYVALKYPEYVQSLIIVGANLETDGMKKLPVFQVKLAYKMTKLLGNVSRYFNQRKQIIDLMLKQLQLTPEQLQTIQAPVLVVAGDHDMIEEDHTKLIAASLPNSQLKIIPDADHFLIMKKPDLFNRLVCSFLEEVYP